MSKGVVIGSIISGIVGIALGGGGVYLYFTKLYKSTTDVEYLKYKEELDEARNTSDAHVGLGLSIVRNIVIKQGGTIKLSNIKPHGLSAEIIYNHRSVCAGGLK